MKFEKKTILNLIGWLTIGILYLLSILIFFLGSSINQIVIKMGFISYLFRPYAVLFHITFLAIIVLSIVFEKVNDELLTGFIACVAITTAVIASFFMLISDIIIFLCIGVLIVLAYFSKQLKWDFQKISTIDIIFGIIGIVSGFWYLFWIDDPIYINAILLSPMGILNSPSILIICGFLCLSQEPRSMKLEITVILTAIWFGILGVFFMGIYINLILILIASYLLIRVIKCVRNEKSIINSNFKNVEIH
ncbi:MAG: hypothetical protein ACFFAO_21010 [Candidatus Hermodarchaeota archaeon]